MTTNEDTLTTLAVMAGAGCELVLRLAESGVTDQVTVEMVQKWYEADELGFKQAIAVFEEDAVARAKESGDPVAAMRDTFSLAALQHQLDAAPPVRDAVAAYIDKASDNAARNNR